MPKLLYVTSDLKGIIRQKKGSGFIYVDAHNKPIKKTNILSRIDSLKIPPAWKNVWISKSANGHIQAYGYDKLNRKQYIYHEHWTKKQSESKFDHLLKFAQLIVKIRRRVTRDLALRYFKKTTMIAAAVKCLDITSIRIGSKQYKSFGLLTLTRKHLNVSGSKIELDFEGKSKQRWHLEFKNKKIATLFKAAEKLQGKNLFKYYDDKKILHTVTVSDINAYLKKITKLDVTAKEFRTWRASCFFIREALKVDSSPSKKSLQIIIKKVAAEMKNTAIICRNSYIHPLLLELYLKDKIKKMNLKSKPLLTLEEQLLTKTLKQYA